ncbi:alpha/beta fold hydrolase [Pontibacter litorisediminis]|uniref:alpha/beta fold hydrolase n=1 Tax=Pontibacter litorisediminis TaxID=1846260 RepID=UPI0023EB05D6|nr:alpha/beta hydrolase [Pontibacter litorisediminis]
MDVLKRHNVKVSGKGKQPMVFAHGYGCDQNMWRFVAPAFEEKYQVVLFDYVGAGKSDESAYSREKYSQLQGYADDILEICHALELRDVILVGHSVSAMIGVLAVLKEPDLFESLVMVSPSPYYISEGDYVGGFNRQDINSLLDTLDSNYLGWASAVAPVIMGKPEEPVLAEELRNSFCRANPEIAKHFARVTFLSDNRSDLPKVGTRSLVLQCTQDIIAPPSVGAFVHHAIPGSELVMLDASGHCPHMSEPEQTIAAIKEFLAHPTGGKGK